MGLAWGNQQRSTTGTSGQKESVNRSENKTSEGLLKTIAVSALSFLLFISLSLFGIAFTINQTLLNPDFVTSEVNRLEISSLADDLLTQNTSSGIQEEIETAVSSAVEKIEPQLKMQINGAVVSIYDYLLGRTENIDMSRILRDTFLSNSFISAVIDEIDIVSLAKPIIKDQVEQQIPADMEFLSSYITSAIDDMVINQEPYIKQQLKNAAGPIADYITGQTETFNIGISTEPLLEDLRTNMLDNVDELPIPGLDLLPPGLVEQAFDVFFNQFSQSIPASVTIDETLIGTDVPANLAASLGEFEDTMKQVREYVSIFQIVYILLIVFMLIFTAGIILLYRSLKKSTRTLGVIFLSYGIVELIGFLVFSNLINSQLGQVQTGTTASLQAWLQLFINHALSPLQIWSICFIAGGIILVLVSIFYRPRNMAM